MRERGNRRCAMSDWAVALTPPRWRSWLLDATPHSRLQAQAEPRLSRLARLRAQSAGHAGAADLHRPGRHGDLRAAGRAHRSARRRPAASACCRRASEYWLGTDQQGRDIWSRIVYGSRTTLLIVFMVAITAAPIGIVIGATAGYLGGWIEARADAPDRCVPGLSQAGAGAGLRGGAGPGHRERRAGHRADRPGRPMRASPGRRR